MSGDYGQSLLNSDKVIFKFQPKTGKSEYLKALVLLNYGDEIKSCELLKNAIHYGYHSAEQLFKERCKETISPN